MKKIFLVLFAGFLLLSPHFGGNTASATYLHAAENISISEPIYGDAYLLAGNGSVDADIFGDLYIVGGNVEVNGNIEEDLVVGGGKVVIFGDIGGDLRIIGGQVAVYGNVGEDIVGVSGQLDISSDTTVGGNVITGAGLMTVDGRIKNNLRGAFGVIFLNGQVDGNVTLSVEDSFVIADDAIIGGNLHYSALLETKVPEGVVQGETTFNKFQRDALFEDLTFLLLMQKLLSFLAMLFLLLVFVIFIPKTLASSAVATRKNILKSFGVGLLTVIGILVGSIILMMTVVGISFAMMALAGALILFYFARIFAAAWLASYIVDFEQKIPRWKLFGVVALGILFYYLLGMIPFHIGRILTIILFLIGAGSLILVGVEHLKFLRAKNKL